MGRFIDSNIFFNFLFFFTRSFLFLFNSRSLVEDNSLSLLQLFASLFLIKISNYNQRTTKRNNYIDEDDIFRARNSG